MRQRHFTTSFNKTKLLSELKEIGSCMEHHLEICSLTFEQACTDFFTLKNDVTCNLLRGATFINFFPMCCRSTVIPLVFVDQSSELI